jgi:hypothetical protein
MQNCEEFGHVYTDVESCEALCEQLDLGESAPGVEADAALDTVQCRYYWANRAAEPSFCQRAGPLGSSDDATSQCGEPCENYCKLLERECGTQFESQFESLADCRTRCDAVPNDPPYRVPGNGEGLPNANTLQCRTYHLNVAMTVREIQAEHDGHCRHAVGISLCTAPE